MLTHIVDICMYSYRCVKFQFDGVFLYVDGDVNQFRVELEFMLSYLEFQFGS
jgi:hypothetical protein